MRILGEKSCKIAAVSGIHPEAPLASCYGSILLFSLTAECCSFRRVRFWHWTYSYATDKISGRGRLSIVAFALKCHILCYHFFKT